MQREILPRGRMVTRIFSGSTTNSNNNNGNNNSKISSRIPHKGSKTSQRISVIEFLIK